MKFLYTGPTLTTIRMMTNDSLSRKSFAATVSAVLLLFAPITTFAGSDEILDPVTDPFYLEMPGDLPEAELYLMRDNARGGLYLYDHQTGQPLILVNESWWFDSLNQLQLLNLDSDKMLEISIQGSFYTGIGPTGAEIFPAEIILDYVDGAWRHRPKVMDSENEFRAEYPGTDHRVRIIDNEKLLMMSGPLQSPTFDATRIDFSKFRIATSRILLSSGSLQVENITVYSSDSHYHIRYRVNTPDIGTTDIKLLTLYAILPRDQREVTIVTGNPPLGSVSLQGIETGVLE